MKRKDMKTPKVLLKNMKTLEDLDNLLINMKTLEDLKNYLIKEAYFEPFQVNEMTPEELFEAYITWNGIIGYKHPDIIKAYQAAFSNN